MPNLSSIIGGGITGLFVLAILVHPTILAFVWHKKVLNEERAFNLANEGREAIELEPIEAGSAIQWVERN
jgi:hypothetical protein